MNPEQSDKTTIYLQFEIFRLPPGEDAMVIGKRAPIGRTAAKRMMDAMAPDQFEYTELDGDDIIEAVLIRKRFLAAIPKNTLLKLICHDAKKVMHAEDIYKVCIDAQVTFRHELRS